ncbi:MAG: DUF2782 domain-containing protein [Burkholderiales bacterium]|nr:DUF2782 domain-containing protein [Burkholderiales bacterium]
MHALDRPTATGSAHRGLAALALAGAFVAGPVLAQIAPAPPPPPPPGAEVPLAASAAGDPDLEPQVTIVRRADETREEVRIGGELKFIKVTPLHGRPYYLVPDANGLTFQRRDSLDTSLKVPMWILFSW